MKNPVQFKEATHPIQNSLGPTSWRCRALLILLTFAIAWFALSPAARAICEDSCLDNYNTAQGEDALFSNTTGEGNTAFGFNALYYNTTGSQNTATGSGALASNTTGNQNTANGTDALHFNTTGYLNTATGTNALHDNTTGSYNTATGTGALYYNTIGSSNTAIGAYALDLNTTGNANTAIGASALLYATNGSYNTAIGSSALAFSATGNDNTAIGANALLNTTGSNNIALGSGAGVNLTTGSNNIDIGNAGVTGEAKKIRIGTKGTHTAAFIAGISGVAVTGTTVVVNTNGRLGVTTSSARFKDEIKPMDKASEAIFALEPVTFRYKKELDPDGIAQFGLVAEEVAKVNPDLVARDDQGKPYTVRYEAVNAMLLNETIKEHRTVEEQGAMIAEHHKEIQALSKMVKEHASQLQKVSAQLATVKTASRVVANNLQTAAPELSDSAYITGSGLK
jgi:Chaperone of endosialidase